MSTTELPAAPARVRGPTLEHVWIALGLGLLALRPLLTAIPPHDFWWHLASGRLISEQGTIPLSDSFSFTRTGAPFFNQSWLAQLLMYGLYQLGGIELIVLVQALVIGLAYGMLLWLCIQRSRRLVPAVVFLLLVTMPLSFDNWNVRPQSYALPLFVAFVLILDRYRAATQHRFWRGHRLWLLPPLMLLWVNFHGSFVLGLALIGLFWSGELLRSLWRGGQGAFVQPRAYFVTLAGWGILTAAATLANPRGIAVLGYVRNLLGSSAVTQLVTEWAPPSIREVNGLIFFVVLIGLATVLIYARRRPDPIELLIVLPFLWLALGAVRQIIWFAILATPLLVSQAATLLPAPAPRRRSGSALLNSLLIGMLGLLLLLASPWVKPTLGLPENTGNLLSTDTPLAAAVFLNNEAPAQRPERLFNREAYGSYLIWASPERPIFIDPRIELYPYEQWRDYILLSQGIDVPRLFRHYAIDGALLDRKTQLALIEVLQADPQWELRYQDARSFYFVRR